MKNVFITGVSGYLGQRIAVALQESARVERMVGIDIREPRLCPSKLTFVKRDVREPAEKLLKDHGIDTVVHAAYVVPPLRDQTLMEQVNLFGTESVLSACAEARVSHLLYTSSATAYGFHPDNPVPLTEESPLRGNDDFTYSKNKKEIERLMADFARAHPEIKVTVLRPCFVVGPGFDNPLSRQLRKRFAVIARGTAPMQFVHEDDVTRIIVLTLEKGIPGVFNVAGEGTLTVPEMIALLGNRPVELPVGLCRTLNSAAWKLRLGFMTESPTPAMNLVLYPWIVSSEKLVRETGYQYLYTTREAFLDFVRHVKTSR